MNWQPDPKCGCFACRLEVPKVVSEGVELQKHLCVVGAENAARGQRIAEAGWEALRSYLFRYRLPTWFETALLQHHADIQAAETQLADAIMQHYDNDRARALAACGPPTIETVDDLRAELVEMREHYARALAQHGVMTA